jgi:hypothetical protein
MSRSEKWRLLIYTALFVLGLLLLLALAPLFAQALPTKTYLCTSAKTGDPAGSATSCAAKTPCGIPVNATDQVRVSINGVQTYEPYATITTTTQVGNCGNGSWSTLAGLGIPLYSSTASTPVPPVVVTPPVTTPTTPAPPVAAPTQSVTVCAQDNPAACATFPGLPVPECFTLSSPTASLTACLPGASL